VRRRDRFVNRRKIVGLSQEKLAEMVGVDRATVMRWETGEFTPQPGQRPLLAKALHVSVEELHGLLGAGTVKPSTAAAIEERTASHQLPEPALTWASGGDLCSSNDQLPWLFDQLRALADDDPAAHSPHRRERAYAQLVQYLATWAHTVNRRELLRVLGWAATAAAGSPALRDLDDQESERIVQAIRAPQRVDHQVAQHIETVLKLCTRQDDLLGPQATLDTVLAQRSLVRSLLPEVRETVRRQLLAAYAGLSRLAAWLSFNFNHYDAADVYYDWARRSAHEAQNSELAAFALANMSHVATYRGEARVAIDHAVLARHWADQTDDRRLQAQAWGATACALALDGQGALALAALDKAQALLAGADAERPSYAYFLPVGGRLNWEETKCHVYLGDYSRGARAAEQDLAGMDPALVRERALTTLELGTCRIRASKPDVTAAVEAIREAGALATHNRSVRLIERLQRSVAELEPWRKVPEVKQVRRELVALGLV
jgi:transcriptional regulator with XRE-family HTH domain